LISGIKNNEFLLYYQPQIDLASKKVVGVEALIRWQHPQKGLILPKDFIPFAEQSGHILQIGNWVLKTACKQKWIGRQKALTI
jgi:EAL domain-containing protein (putative c-di-GMP-specific phosphodiesterase class I)